MHWRDITLWQPYVEKAYCLLCTLNALCMCNKVVSGKIIDTQFNLASINILVCEYAMLLSMRSRAC